ncbi:hypothetical protein AB4391_01415 [Vibrio lentus]|uniref:Uncharacterized protein n=1 Tax=Vibrio lentus TaxID=136468 RepID=A0A2N7KP46_9VIBR|nr:hypothetical protein [Vibrio lentus]PMM78477.1 hypothetical protein BCT49_00285 [Vibrio lentus]
MHQSIKNADIEHVLKEMYFATISQTYIHFTRAIDLLFTRYTSSAICVASSDEEKVKAFNTPIKTKNATLAFTLYVCGLYAHHAKKRGDKFTMRLCENCAKCIEDHLPCCDEQKAISSVLMQLREQPSIF